MGDKTELVGALFNRQDFFDGTTLASVEQAV